MLEQWAAGITTPSMRQEHPEITIHYIHLVKTQSHAKTRMTLMKAYTRPQGTMAWAPQELRPHQQA